MIKLSTRLKTVASLVNSKSKIIDIGCDHALLDIYLVSTYKNMKIIVSDINENALNNAINNIKKSKLEDRIFPRLGKGLNTLEKKDNANTIIISGLGANTIVGILYNDIDKLQNIDNIIVQSNTNLNFLRSKIVKLNYYIEEEIQIKENNIIYTIIKFSKGKRKYKLKELYFGPILLHKKDELFKEYNDEEKKKLEHLMQVIPKKNLHHRITVYLKLRMYKNI